MELADRVVLVRHGIAHPRSPFVADHNRKLTAHGRRLLEDSYPGFFSSLLDDGDEP